MKEGVLLDAREVIHRAPGNGLAAHILPTSATMIGICMTVLSIGHLGPAGEMRLIVDKLLAVDALIFLTSALLSFVSMRSSRAALRFESRAELIFIGGLVMLAMVAVALAFAIT
jgi:hypothetical protein